MYENKNRAIVEIVKKNRYITVHNKDHIEILIRNNSDELQEINFALGPFR